VKDTYYFSHDSNARNDEKILMLRAEHGWEGYGIYWALIEMMFESADTALYHDKIKGIAFSYNIDITLLKSVINTCIREGLFVSDDDMFWSESLRRRKGKYHELKQKRSDAGKKGMAKRWGTDNTVITDENNSNNNDITNNNKVKESKGKESKGKEKKINVDAPTPTPKKNKYGEFQKVCLSDEEYLKLNEKLGQLMAEDLITRLDSYKASTGKNYKSDYATILNWSRKEPININKPNQSKQYSNPFLELLKEELDKEANPFE